MTRGVRVAGTMAAAIVMAAGVIAQADKIAKSTDGTCLVTVPGTWALGSVPSLATSSDKNMSVIVSSPKMIDSFDELKKLARSTYPESKVTKDSATEFEMQGKSVTGKPDVYRAIPAGPNKFCIAEITYDSGTVDDARKIVLTLKTAGK